VTGERLFRGVDGDVPLPLPVEEGDVLCFRLRSRVGQRVVARGVNLGEEIAVGGHQRPQVLAEVAHVDGIGFVNLVAEQRLGPPQIARIDGAGDQPIRGDHHLGWLQGDRPRGRRA